MISMAFQQASLANFIMNAHLIFYYSYEIVALLFDLFGTEVADTRLIFHSPRINNQIISISNLFFLQ